MYRQASLDIHGLYEEGELCPEILARIVPDKVFHIGLRNLFQRISRKEAVCRNAFPAFPEVGHLVTFPYGSFR